MRDRNKIINDINTFLNKEISDQTKHNPYINELCEDFEILNLSNKILIELFDKDREIRIETIYEKFNNYTKSLIENSIRFLLYEGDIFELKINLFKKL